MPKYWREIAIGAQEDAAAYYAEAIEAAAASNALLWHTCMELAGLAYARSRWAMEAPGDCP